MEISNVLGVAFIIAVTVFIAVYWARRLKTKRRN